MERVAFPVARWHAFITGWVSADIGNAHLMNAAWDKAMFGWPCDAEIEKAS